VAVGDVDGDGTAEIVTGPGPTRHADVGIFTAGGDRLRYFRIHADFMGGLFVAVPAPLGPRLEMRVALPQTGVEGRTLRLVASIVDARGGASPEEFAARISWGDGEVNPTSVRALGGGRYVVEGLHGYTRGDTYQVRVRVFDVHLRTTVVTATTVVSHARLGFHGRTIRVDGSSFRGLIATVVDGNPYSWDARRFRAWITWGDGRRSKARLRWLPPDRVEILGAHRYPVPGLHRVTVRVREIRGRTVVGTSWIRTTR
jgi:hypothetical protein